MMQINCLTLHTPLTFWLGKKVRQRNLIELSGLIGFCYDVSDTQDGLKCWRM